MKLLSIILILNLAQTESDLMKRFYRGILQNIRSEEYLLVTISKADTSDEAIVQNTDLFVVMNRDSVISEELFFVMMMGQVGDKGYIEINPLEDDRLKFKTDIRSSIVDSIAGFGQKAFIEHYFIKGVMKKGVNRKYEYAIIRQLFLWRIHSYSDDETGYLVLPFYRE